MKRSCLFLLQVAIKILEKKKIIERGTKERVEREILILKQLHHINLIRLYEVNIILTRLLKPIPLYIW
jgi:serine/threonine protein kinase